MWLRRSAVLSFTVGISLCGLTACSDDAAEAIDPGPTGAPTMRITEPSSSPACVSIGDDADTRVPILVDVEEMLLRPPGGCEGITQCGRLALYAENVLNNETSVPAVDLLVYRLGDPYHDGSTHQGTGEPDVLDVRIAIIGEDTDEVLLDRDAEPLEDTIQLITVPDCDAL